MKPQTLQSACCTATAQGQVALVHRKAGLAQQRIALLKLGRAQAGHRGGNAKHVMRDFAGRQIGFVQ